jgi:AcrR family transcriptional regulator
MSQAATDKYQQQRAQAIRSAAAVFAEKGFHGASTKDIAERIGIKQGSLYYYFKSKEEALGEVCLYGIEDYVHRMGSISASNQPFEAKLLATVTSHLSSYRERNEALKVHNDERLYLPEEKRQKLHELGSQYRKSLQGIFQEGVSNGELRDSIDCHFAAQAVIGICNAWGDIIVREPDLDIFDVTQKCVDLLLNGFCERRKNTRQDRRG